MVRHVASAIARVLWISTMVLVPLFGFWLASSLAAYHNASPWLAALFGLALFPILPIGWDLFFRWRRSKQPPKKPILTPLDRLVLRTLVVNGLFIGGMLYFARATAFHALAVRGDWMLDGHDGAAANDVRDVLLGIADHLDHRRTKDTFGTSDTAPTAVQPTPIVVPTPTGPVEPAGWPLPEAPDPKIEHVPDESSIAAVGGYLREQFPDPKLRTKALHDYVVMRLHYDEDALVAAQAGDYEKVPSQEAEEVFARRSAICEGYARLVVALGKEAGLEIAYVTGYIRDAQRRVTDGPDLETTLEGYSHAWNAVKLDNQWYLLDATWDDPTGGAETLTSTYLFTPPRLFIYDHLPKDPAWQLLPTPISAGDFAREPLLSPSIGKLGVELVEPTRSQVTVNGTLHITLKNPYHAAISADARGSVNKRCTVEHGEEVTCELPAGEYEVRLYGAPAARAHGSFTLDYIGSILVNSR